MRDAAHERIRPYGPPVVGDFDGEIDDAKFAEQQPRARPPRSELLPALLHAALQAQRCVGQQRGRIAGLAQFGDECARREELAQTHRQFRGICFYGARQATEVLGILTECHGSLAARMPRMSSLWESVSRSGESAAGIFHGRAGSIALAGLAEGSILNGRLESLRGLNVVLAMREQLANAVALVELDGVARRLVLCTPDLTPEQLAGVGTAAEADVVLDQVALEPGGEKLQRRRTADTEWILLTSGTTGLPKLVVHSFDSLAGALPRHPTSVRPMVWSTFYDIRRYGGLQIYLRAVLSGSPLVLSSAGEPTVDFLARAAAAGVTHISGTPSHWRRALMSGEAAALKPRYVRLSGEVADQAVLDNLRAVYPNALVAHAFASTEAGVAFEVNDGLAGFPQALIDDPSGDMELKVVDHTLRIRSGRTAARYLGTAPEVLVSD